MIFDNRNYISVLTPPVSGTELYLTLEDFTFDNVFTLAVSGLLTTDNEIQMSNKVATQLTTFFQQNNIQFNGVPTYVDLPAVQQYNVTRTDHCTCVWGQSNFTISASSDTGSIIHIDNQPTLLTVSDIRTLAPMKGVDLTDDNGDDLTDSQVAILSKLASAKLIAFTRNPIVLSTYLEEKMGNGEWGIRLNKSPAVDFFPPQVRQPIAFNLFSAVVYTTVKGNYILERSGYLTYRFGQSLVDYPQPYDFLNDIIVAYLAGYPTIPVDIDNVILELLPVIQAQIPPGVESMKGGTFSISFGGVQDVFNNLMISLRPYYLTE